MCFKFISKGGAKQRMRAKPPSKIQNLNKKSKMKFNNKKIGVEVKFL